MTSIEGPYMKWHAYVPCEPLTLIPRPRTSPSERSKSIHTDRSSAQESVKNAARRGVTSPIALIQRGSRSPLSASFSSNRAARRRSRGRAVGADRRGHHCGGAAVRAGPCRGQRPRGGQHRGATKTNRTEQDLRGGRPRLSLIKLGALGRDIGGVVQEHLLHRRILCRRSRRPPLTEVFSGPGPLRSYASAPTSAVWAWHLDSLCLSLGSGPASADGREPAGRLFLADHRRRRSDRRGLRSLCRGLSGHRCPSPPSCCSHGVMPVTLVEGWTQRSKRIRRPASDWLRRLRGSQPQAAVQWGHAS